VQNIMKINHEIIRCPDGTYAIWQGDTLVSEGWRTVEDARLHATAARKNAKKGGRPQKTPAGWNIVRREDGRYITWAATKREADRLARSFLGPTDPFTYRAVRVVAK
jgi:uncharacterized protein YbdZ (MbtH family)